MVQTIQAKSITLQELREKFDLQLVEDEGFFREWQDNLPEIPEVEKQRLDRVKASYINLLNYPPLLENTVKMVVLSPLLDLAGFYLSPFHIKSEQSVEIIEEDEGVVVKGQLDALVLRERLWVLVIESKQAAFSIEVGLAQLLAYILANPHLEKPNFGLLTTGGSFMFVKLIKGETLQYATSNVFELRNRGNELYSVLGILKALGALSS
ncbi:MAG: restriction endonuclease subunit R [Kastovskya adunca ATA6-11-RM4]|nr:restriction endonuclease subunit R [Kastovskya adunca ATA6-11-RM4]